MSKEQRILDCESVLRFGGKRRNSLAVSNVSNRFNSWGAEQLALDKVLFLRCSWRSTQQNFQQ